MKYQDANGNDNFIPMIQESFKNLLMEIKTPAGGLR